MLIFKPSGEIFLKKKKTEMAQKMAKMAKNG